MCGGEDKSYFGFFKVYDDGLPSVLKCQVERQANKTKCLLQ